jgi:hypothetical protein
MKAFVGSTVSGGGPSGEDKTSRAVAAERMSVGFIAICLLRHSQLGA